MGYSKALLSDVGFSTLLKASAIWFGIFIVVTLIINVITNIPPLSAEILSYVRDNPVGAAKLMAELITALMNPFADNNMSLLSKFIPLNGLVIYMLSLLVDSTLFIAFLFTMLSGLNLWGGVRRIMGTRNYIALAGSTISMIGSVMAFLGFIIVMLVNVTPVVNQGMHLAVSNTAISMSIPIPWPITLGMALWIIGIAILSIAFLITFIRARDIIGIVSMAMLVITPLLVVMPILCFGLMTIGTAIIVLSNRGVSI